MTIRIPQHLSFIFRDVSIFSVIINYIKTHEWGYVHCNDVQAAFLPCATSDIQDMSDVVFSQEVTKEFSVRLGSFPVSANVVLPNSRCFAIRVLIGNTRNTNS